MAVLFRDSRLYIETSSTSAVADMQSTNDKAVFQSVLLGRQRLQTGQCLQRRRRSSGKKFCWDELVGLLSPRESSY